jgi:hypothetical protein
MDDKEEQNAAFPFDDPIDPVAARAEAFSRLLPVVEATKNKRLRALGERMLDVMTRSIKTHRSADLTPIEGVKKP